MNSVDHATARRGILEGEETPAIRSHVDTCSSCATFAAKVGGALRLAGEMTPPPMPSDLPQKVLHRVQVISRPAPPIPAEPRQISRLPKHSPRREILVSAAVVLFLIIALLIPILTRESPQALLRSAAQQTAAEGTARLELNGAIGGDNSNEMNADQRQGAGSGSTEGSLRLVIDAEGDISFHDRLRLKGSVEVERAPEGLDVKADAFHLVTVGERTLAFGPSGIADRTGRPPAGQILRGPDSVLDALNSGSRGPIVRLGEKQVGREPLLGFRFQLPAKLLQAPFKSSSASPWTVEAWVGAVDRTLRILSVSARGIAASPVGIRWEASITTRLFGFGAPSLQRPEPGQVVAEGIGVLPLPPERSLKRFAGRLVEANTVEVQSVVSDEGFWIGRSAGQRVFVRLLASGESRPNVTAAARVSFIGVMRRNPPEASSLGVTGAEGAKLLDLERYHIQVPVETLRVEFP